MIDHYDWAGGREAMLRFGPDTGPVVIAAMPLFEEANRTRAFMGSILRALAARGIASILPDLPGTGESILPTECTDIMKMREAFEAVAELMGREGRAAFSVAIRSGALLDTCGRVLGRWHFAPIDGDSTLRELHRIKQAAFDKNTKFDLHVLPGDDGDPPIEIAGNLVSLRLLRQLDGLIPVSARGGGALRTVRLESDPNPADLKLAGSPLWRRSEPGNDLALARLLADDIAAWIATCAV